ncbi:MAG: sulfite oxidase-like oxidoreductase [Betaproteobacteria bacterium]|nr:sulfite oxidase-like oxidoreductase [Betaproteobacteria bacterium]MDE1982286.1 sulfite oxidase-like oxidoreductase [Betaproteobacteria bacterium]MDE2131199.1 sulfite oxidase-like oxidoreductase [Betaproteobacteria bacterium]MDE2211197.1 sulfite oxidase-like oxidoreductase [Betaproteobacteria bacterium]
MTDWNKFIQAKIAVAQREMKPGKPHPNERIPSGQTEVRNFPILDLGIRPLIPLEHWRLRVFGQVEKEIDLNWPDFLALPQTVSVSDFHCVTRWSQLDMEWHGVLARDLLLLASPRPAARFVTLHGYDDYSTNLPLEALLDDDVIIAHRWAGQPIPRDHGGPVRIIVPKRYAWKGAKWLKSIELHERDRPGFWEVRGYHNDGDPWKEQRFGWPGQTGEED